MSGGCHCWLTNQCIFIHLLLCDSIMKALHSVLNGEVEDLVLALKIGSWSS